MKNLHSRLAALLLPCLLAAGCQDPVATAAEEETGTVEMLFDVGDLGPTLEADELIASFQRVDEMAAPAVEDTVAVNGSAASLAVVLRPGRWQILVRLLSEGEEVAFGEGSALVQPGFVTQVDIELAPGTGAVELRVRWAEDFTGTIADLSGRPVTVEIGSFGAYRVHGLSRIGWDIEVIESPLDGGRTHKDAGRISFPDIVLTGLMSTREQVEALASWADTPALDTHLTFLLQGLGGEHARVNVLGARFVDADVTIQPTNVDDQVMLAGLRVRIPVEVWDAFETLTLMELSDYLPLDPYPGCPAPAHVVEIDGVTAGPPLGPCYAQGELALPAVGSSDALHLPAVRDGQGLYLWAFDTRREVQEFACVGCNFGKRSMSVISLDGTTADTETGRINLFEVWPSSFTFFDPEVEYGHHYLFSVDIQTDRVEQGL